MIPETLRSLADSVTLLSGLLLGAAFGAGLLACWPFAYLAGWVDGRRSNRWRASRFGITDAGRRALALNGRDGGEGTEP